MTEESAENYAEKYLQQASEFLSDGRLLHEKERFRSAADRIYYAMFWAAQAALISQDITTRSHQGLINQFSKEFVKPGAISVNVFRYLQEAFETRQETTYAVGAAISPGYVNELLDKAEEFIDRVSEVILPQE